MIPSSNRHSLMVGVSFFPHPLKITLLLQGNKSGSANNRASQGELVVSAEWRKPREVEQSSHPVLRLLPSSSSTVSALGALPDLWAWPLIYSLEDFNRNCLYIFPKFEKEFLKRAKIMLPFFKITTDYYFFIAISGWHFIECVVMVH